MSIVYLLQNQNQHFLDKSGEWVTAENTKPLYRTQFKDEAINRKVEFSVKNFELRIVVTQATVAENGNLVIEQKDAPNNPKFDKTDNVMLGHDSANEDLFLDPHEKVSNGELDITPITDHCSTDEDQFREDANLEPEITPIVDHDNTIEELFLQQADEEATTVELETKHMAKNESTNEPPPLKYSEEEPNAIKLETESDTIQAPNV